MKVFLVLTYILAAFAAGWDLGRSFMWVRGLPAVASYLITFFIADIAMFMCFFTLMAIIQKFKKTNETGVE